MNYFDNRFFNIGFVLILIAGGISLILTSSILDIVAGIIAIIGMITMLYGIKQTNKKT